MALTVDGLHYRLTATSASVSESRSAKGAITIPATINSGTQPLPVTAIGSHAFFLAQALTSVTFADRSEVSTIEPTAFQNSTIARLTLPPKVTVLPPGIFRHTAELLTVDLGANPNFVSVDGLVFDRTRETLFFVPRNKQGKVIVPASVRTVGAWAFGGCTKVTEIQLDGGCQLTEIQDGAFSETMIKGFVIQQSVTVLGKSVFFGCTQLENVTFQGVSKIKVIPEAAFRKTNIKEINVPAAVEKLEKWAFAETYALQKVNFPAESQLTTIEADVFMQTSIETLDIPPKVNQLEPNFFCAESLKTINPGRSNFKLINDLLVTPDKKRVIWAPRTIETAILGQDVQEIGDFAFFQCRSLKKVIGTNAKLVRIGAYAFGWTKLKEFAVQDTVTEIGEGAFTNCYDLAEFTIGTEVEKIGSVAFGMTAFQKLDIPAKVTKLGDSLFQNSSVEEVGIPASIDKISRLMFFGCKSLKKVVVRARGQITILPAAFENCPENVVLAVSPGVGVGPSTPPNVNVKNDASMQVGPTPLEPITPATALSGVVIENGKFEDVEQIGRGSYGDVWKVRRVDSGRIAAKKQITKDDKQSPNELLQQVQREVSVLLKVKGHPAVIGLVGFTPPLGTNVSYIYMQYMENKSLDHAIHQTKPSPTLKAKWALGIAKGLEFMHRKEVIHRDIKPGNILLDGNNEVRIADFGSSVNQQTQTSRTRTGGVGTLFYIAPELHEGTDDSDAAVDVYSYAILVWEIITGEVPYQGVHLTNEAQKVSFLKKVREGLRPKLDGIPGWTKEFLSTRWLYAPMRRGTMDDVVSTLADHNYEIVPGVDSAVVADYHHRIEEVEAALLP
jgi:hypothetical protein